MAQNPPLLSVLSDFFSSYIYKVTFLNEVEEIDKDCKRNLCLMKRVVVHSRSWSPVLTQVIFTNPTHMPPRLPLSPLQRSFLNISFPSWSQAENTPAVRKFYSNTDTTTVAFTITLCACHGFVVDDVFDLKLLYRMIHLVPIYSRLCISGGLQSGKFGLEMTTKKKQKVRHGKFWAFLCDSSCGNRARPKQRVRKPLYRLCYSSSPATSTCSKFLSDYTEAYIICNLKMQSRTADGTDRCKHSHARPEPLDGCSRHSRVKITFLCIHFTRHLSVCSGTSFLTAALRMSWSV